MSAEADVPQRPVELSLARVHLRLGSLALARAELEILGAAGELDGPGEVDLAEVRWRTGDLTGAGAAAAAALASGQGEPVLFVIAAEAASALGRPNEARRLANLALEGVDGSIDAIFAGTPRSGVWPTDAAEPPPTTGTLFDRDPAPSPRRRAGDADRAAAAARSSPAEADVAGLVAAPLTLGFWDADRISLAEETELPDPNQELEAGRAALALGRLDEASLRFAVALRLAPALAPAILEETDGPSAPAIHLVRGDAYRLVGLESEARRAYVAAAWSGARDRRGRAGPGPAPGSPGDEPAPAGAGAADGAADGEAATGASAPGD